MGRCVIIIAVLGIACGKNGATPAGGQGVASGSDTPASAAGSADPNAGADAAKVEAELAALEQLKIKTCACADLPCVEKVGLEYQAWQGKAKTALTGVASSKAQKERGTRLEDELKACHRWVEAGLGSGAGGSEANAKIEIALVELERFRNKLCACTDVACADQVTAEKKAWESALRAKMGSAKPDDKQKQRGKLFEDGMQECRSRIAGGGGGGDTKVAARFDGAVAELKALKTKMCACADKACGDKVDEEYKAWKAALAAEMKGHKPTKDQQARGDEVLGALRDCRAKLVK